MLSIVKDCFFVTPTDDQIEDALYGEFEDFMNFKDIVDDYKLKELLP